MTCLTSVMMANSPAWPQLKRGRVDRRAARHGGRRARGLLGDVSSLRGPPFSSVADMGLLKTWSRLCGFGPVITGAAAAGSLGSWPAWSLEPPELDPERRAPPSEPPGVGTARPCTPTSTPATSTKINTMPAAMARVMSRRRARSSALGRHCLRSRAIASVRDALTLPSRTGPRPRSSGGTRVVTRTASRRCPRCISPAPR